MANLFMLISPKPYDIMEIEYEDTIATYDFDLAIQLLKENKNVIFSNETGNLTKHRKTLIEKARKKVENIHIFYLFDNRIENAISPILKSFTSFATERDLIEGIVYLKNKTHKEALREQVFFRWVTKHFYQNNVWHPEETLFKHVDNVGKNLPNPYFPYYEHDLGKIFTQTYKRKKDGKETLNAHYYGHDKVSAWLTYALFVPEFAYKFDDHVNDMLDYDAAITERHMTPINSKKNSILNDYFAKKGYGKNQFKRDLKLFQAADKKRNLLEKIIMTIERKIFPD